MIRLDVSSIVGNTVAASVPHLEEVEAIKGVHQIPLNLTSSSSDADVGVRALDHADSLLEVRNALQLLPHQ